MWTMLQRPKKKKKKVRTIMHRVLGEEALIVIRAVEEVGR
jgi:hypothetical protein